jgi:hypothetical protein
VEKQTVDRRYNHTKNDGAASACQTDKTAECIQGKPFLGLR